MGRVKYLSLFSGIGGFENGIQNAYRGKERRIEANKTRNKGQRLLALGGEGVSASDGRFSEHHSNLSNQRPLCIGYSEIDKYAIKVYERQFNGHTNYGDITKINAEELPDFDLLVGGFPCQSFSVAGKRKGFNDTRGTLFFDIARILSEKRPRHFLLENVKGLLSHDKGKTFQTILGVLADLGYRVEWQVLNSKNFGVPQNRERIFIIGHLRDECGRKVFPITGTDTENIEQFVDLTIGNNSKTTKQSRTLQARYFKGYSKRPAETSGVIRQLNQPTHSNDRVYSDKGISPTLNTMQGGNRQPFVEQNPRIRRLTPLECERLQGFPDNWTKYGIGDEPISDTQRYKMCGNAVTVNTIEAIINNFDCLESNNG